MDWTQERYVRLYTRDSTTWKLLDWRARCTLSLLLRKLDRAGVFDHDRHRAMGLAAVIELPIEIVDPGITQLVKLGVVLETDREYVVPNFIAAQEATQDEATRSRSYRERKRDFAIARAKGLIDDGGSTAETVTKRDAGATPRDGSVTKPTTRDETPHPASRTVTPNLTVPNQAESEIASTARARDLPTQVPVRAPGPGDVTASEEMRSLVQLAERSWDELNTARNRIALKLGIEHVRQLHPHLAGRAELGKRLRESGCDRAAADFAHVLRVLEREALATKSVSKLSGSMFSAKAWEWALGQQLDGEAAFGPRSAQRNQPAGGVSQALLDMANGDT